MYQDLYLVEEDENQEEDDVDLLAKHYAKIEEYPERETFPEEDVQEEDVPEEDEQLLIKY